MSTEPSEGGPVPAVAWQRVQAAATLVISLSLFSVIALAGELIPPVLIFGLLYLVIGAGLWQFTGNRRVSITGAVLVLLGILGNIPFLTEDLAHPETWGTFAPAAVMVVGTLAAVGAAIMAFRSAPAEAARPFSIGAAVLGVALVVITVGMSLATSSDTAEANDVTVVAEGAEFPETLEVPAGGWLFLQNKDLFRHTFVVEDEDVKVEMPGGKNRRVQLDLPAGEYRFICDVPGHERMEGALTVR